MKISKGYSLEQFIVIVDNHPLKGSCQFDSVKRYNDLLRKRVDVEMFINPLSPPMKGDYGLDAEEFNTYKYPQECYESDLERYEQAEKKVIFNMKNMSVRGVQVFYDVGDHGAFKGITVSDYDNLGELFRSTAGRLELKPFII